LGSAAAAVAATTIVPRYVFGGPKFVPPSEKVNIALVGAGGQGRSNTRLLFREDDAQVMAVADPIEQHNLDAFYYRGAGGREPVKAEIEKHYGETTPNHRCAAYEDFRVMLEKEKAIDAILCATPDHLHAYVSVIAMRAGKHVYCEKPLTHNVWEARQVAKVAKETGVATQMGNQGHSRDGIRQTCEWIWDGVIGPVHEVHAWVNAGRWNKQLTSQPAETPRCLPVSTGTCGWDRASRAPTIQRIHRSLGATSGRLARVPWAISAATILTPPCGLLIWRNQQASKRGPLGTWTRRSLRTARSATTVLEPAGISRP